MKGKRAVVTGASLGIGAASVKLLADHGADVVFCARNREAVKDPATYSSKGGTVTGLVADMGNAESTDNFGCC